MAARQGGEEMPLEACTVPGVVEKIDQAAVKRRAAIRYAAALTGALLLGAAVTAAALLVQVRTWSKEAGATSNRIKVNVTCSIQKSDEQGRYHIFTVDRAATYLIYGWLAFSPAGTEQGETVVLKQTLNRSEMNIQTKPRKAEVFFFEKVKMADYSTVSVHFSGQHTEGSFHIYEL